MFKKILQLSFEKELIIASLKVALVVGIILNLINQGDQMINGRLNQINWFKFWLTFFVPYAVSTYASVRTKLKNE